MCPPVVFAPFALGQHGVRDSQKDGQHGSVGDQGMGQHLRLSLWAGGLGTVGFRCLLRVVEDLIPPSLELVSGWAGA